MKPPPKPIDRTTAWVCLTTNLFVMPGVGSWMVGQRALAVTHVLMSLGGVLLMTVWLCWFVFQWIRNERMPQSFGPYFWTAVLSVVLFAGAWLWSLMSSVALLRRVSANPSPTGENQPPKLN